MTTHTEILVKVTELRDDMQEREKRARTLKSKRYARYAREFYDEVLHHLIGLEEKKQAATRELNQVESYLYRLREVQKALNDGDNSELSKEMHRLRTDMEERREVLKTAIKLCE